MPLAIRQVAVVGSGVMGSQIAAHITNAGLPVLLLDRVAEGATHRSQIAQDALERLRVANPSPFIYPDNASLIAVGNIADDIDKLRSSDWIIEAVHENLEVKSALYKKIDAVRKRGSIVSSTTSVIPHSALISGQSPQFAQDFLIAQFFNPMHSTRLLEMVFGAETRQDAVDLIRDFCDRKLGKHVIMCHDTPGFVANRLGLFWFQSIIYAASDFGLSLEDAGEACARIIGVRHEGVWGLINRLGFERLSLMNNILANTLPANDPFVIKSRDLSILKEIETYAFASTKPVAMDTGRNIRTLCETNDKFGRFAWRVLSDTLVYAFMLVPATVVDIARVDEAMRCGYNWSYGPFELIDIIGARWMKLRLLSEQRPVPEMLRVASDKAFYRIDGGRQEYLTIEGNYAPIKRAPGILLLVDVKRTSMPMLSNDSAAVWDVGNGVLCFEQKSKAINLDVLSLLDKTRSVIGDGRGAYKGLVIYNDNESFAIDADVGFFMENIKNGRFDLIEDFIRRGQAVFKALRFASFPSVAATAGVVLGSKCEMMLHCSAIQPHVEYRAGFSEINIGLIPGWGGCTQMLGRAIETHKRDSGVSPVNQVFEIISSAKISNTVAEALGMNFLRPTDTLTVNKDRLLHDAKQKVLGLAKDYRPPKPRSYSLPGTAGRAALDMLIDMAKHSGKLLAHDIKVLKSLSVVLCGGDNTAKPLSEEQIMELERHEFMRLIRTPESAARIETILKTGKALRN